jgi:hypothetical protein
MKNTKNSNEIYNLIPKEYSDDEKNEIIRLINEYNSICLNILEYSINSSQEI